MKIQHVKVKLGFVMMIVAATIALYACRTDNDAAPSSPAITTLTPSQGAAGTEVSVQGRGFGTTTSNLTVAFNGIGATVKSVTDILLVATVPDLATTGPVTVSVNGVKATGPIFTVTNKPAAIAITALDPVQGPVGTSVKIKGVSFGTVASNLAVTFNGVVANITRASDIELVVTVPVSAVTGNVKVTLNGSTATGPVFTVTETPAVINSISPTSGPKETEVTITGTNFRTIAEENLVTFNGKPAEVTHATTTALTVKVPLGAGTGIVKVTKGTLSSDGPVFEYVFTAVVSTLAGNGTATSVDGVGVGASLHNPYGITMDKDGNIFFSEAGPSRIRKINTAGEVTTIAGSNDGYADASGNAAKFYTPRELNVDGQNNLIVADYDNMRIRNVNPAGDVTTLAGTGTIGFADGVTTAAQFILPSGIAVASDNTVYVADEGNHRIRKIADGQVSTLAGKGTTGYADGQGNAAQFSGPICLAIDTDGNLYTSDYGGAHIRKITPNGQVTTVAGAGVYGYLDGQATAARFNKSRGITVDASGTLYVADTDNNCIRKISNGVVTTIAGSNTPGYADGESSAAMFDWPTGIVVDATGALYVCDYHNARIRKIIFE